MRHTAAYRILPPQGRIIRFLIYLAQEYQMVVNRAERSLFGSGRISLPTPQCVVFYNGKNEMPEETTLKLSDAFENKKARADVELTVRMLNINHGHNEQLMEKCRVLEEYAHLVAVTRDFMRTENDLQTALNKAIDYCIKNGILKEFLLRNRAEVLGMLLEEFDAEKYERTLRAEGREEGRVEGRAEGESRINRLIQLLMAENRQDDLLRSTTDETYRETLFQEFGIE